MVAKRTRRIVQVVLLPVVIPIVLVTSYVSAWVTISKAAHEGLISGGTARAARPAFQPILYYCDSKLPGARLLTAFWWKMSPAIVRHSDDGMRIWLTDAHVLSPTQVVLPSSTTGMQTYVPSPEPLRPIHDH